METPKVVIISVTLKSEKISGSNLMILWWLYLVKVILSLNVLVELLVITWTNSNGINLQKLRKVLTFFFMKSKDKLKCRQLLSVSNKKTSFWKNMSFLRLFKRFQWIKMLKNQNNSNKKILFQNLNHLMMISFNKKF